MLYNKIRVCGRKITAFMTALGVVGGFAGATVGATAMIASAPVSVQAETDLENWQKLKFGMFFCWGPYSVYAGVYNGRQLPGEWEQIQRVANIPYTEYARIFPTWTNKYKASEYVRLAKVAGIKYIVPILKHHDGFCMFDTKAQTPAYSLNNLTPSKIDIFAELSKAVAAEPAMKLSFYYSSIDWHYPLRTTAPNSWGYFEPVSKALEDYQDAQLKELCSNYGPITSIFFDMAQPTKAQSQRWKTTIRNLQPHAIINGRLNNFLGDYFTPTDMAIPTEPRALQVAFEVPYTLQGWCDVSWLAKPSLASGKRTVVRCLMEVTTKGGNYLFNIVTRGDGSIHPWDSTLLEEVGKWMSKNGEAVHGCDANPFRTPPSWGYCSVNRTTKKLYLSVATWPASPNRLTVPGFLNPVTKATILSTGQAVTTSRSGNDLIVQLPATDPDPSLSIVALEYTGSLDILNKRTVPDANNIINLPASNAFSYSYYKNPDFWPAETKDAIRTWDFSVKTPGKYDVEVTYTLAATKSYTFTIDTTKFNVSLTGGTAAQTKKIGQIALDVDPMHVLKVRTIDSLSLGITISNIRLTFVGTAANPSNNSHPSFMVSALNTVRSDGTISYVMEKSGSAAFALYALNGDRLAAVTMNSVCGHNTYVWNALKNRPAGSYILAMSVNGKKAGMSLGFTTK